MDADAPRKRSRFAGAPRPLHDMFARARRADHRGRSPDDTGIHSFMDAAADAVGQAEIICVEDHQTPTGHFRGLFAFAVSRITAESPRIPGTQSYHAVR